MRDDDKEGENVEEQMAADPFAPLLDRWREHDGATDRSWFLWEERLKNFRSARRGALTCFQRSVAEINRCPLTPTERPDGCPKRRGGRLLRVNPPVEKLFTSLF